MLGSLPVRTWGALVLVASLLPTAARGLEQDASSDGQRAAPVRLPTSPSGWLSPADVPRIASYEIHATLDVEAHRVAARGKLRFTNRSREPVDELYFHLYLNAFRDDKSLFLRSPRRRSRMGHGLGEPGAIEVERLTSPRHPGVELWERAERHSPGDPDDATDIRVPLPEPLSPGETLELELVFTSRLPTIVERTGFARSFHMVAQWFPKLARLEEDGSWAHFPFHPHAEFYADFGDYDVTLDVPEGFVVGATGQLTSSRTEGSRRVDRYSARGVHDFAWSAWDGFEREERRLGDVDVTLLAPPGTTSARLATWTALEHALPFLEHRYGPYPHPTLTVVHPPSFAAGAGGMEYPTLITTGGSARWPQLGVRLIEQVTVHELAHQWFQGLLASNEAAFPFLDEGLTSYAEWQAMGAQFGAGSIVDSLGLRVSLEAVGRAAAVHYGRLEPIAQPASEFESMRSLAAHVYSGTATALTTLARVYGAPKMEAALRAYARRHRFGHPEPEDLLRSIEEHMGADAAVALRTMLFERGSINFEVVEVTGEPSAPNEPGDPNFANGADGAKPNGANPNGANPNGANGVRAKPGFTNRAVVARRGSLRLPVTVRLEFEGGGSVEQRWDGAESLLTLERHDEKPLRRVVVDPERAVLWDENLLDNAAGVRKPSSLRSSERVWYWAEVLLHLLSP